MRRFITITLLMTCFFSGCAVNSENFYKVCSPDKDQCLTFVVIDRLFNFGKLDNGIYMFVGEISKNKPLPNKYLKLQYGDWPIGIVWGEIITFMYWDILENKLESNDDIKVIQKTVSEEFNLIEQRYKEENKLSKTVYYFDEILRNPMK